MRVKESALQKIKCTGTGARLIEDLQYRIIVKAVVSLIFNLMYAFYNGILGILSSSLLFLTSAAYYLLLSAMRFSAIILKKNSQSENRAVSLIGIMLIFLSIIFHIMVIISMKEQTAAVHGMIPMITIATFTFTKITTAAVTALRHRREYFGIIKAINAIRYSEVAVSLLIMQQSMLASFGDGNDRSAVILNACTGAGVCFFILALGIITFKNSRKENNYGKIQDGKDR